MGLYSNIKRFFFTRYTDGTWWINSNTHKSNKKEYMELFENVHILNSVINIGASYACKFKWGVKIGEEIDYEHPRLELIKNPNPYQTTVDLIRQLYIYKSVHGWAYQKTFGGRFSEPKAIYNLNPCEITFNDYGNKPLLAWKREDITQLKDKSFTYNDNGVSKTFYFKDVMKYYDVANGLYTDGCSMYKSPSKVTAVLDSITNIDLALKAQNVGTQTIGRESIFKESKTSNSELDFGLNGKKLTEKERQDVEYKLNNKSWLRNKRLRTSTPDVPLTHLDLSLDSKNFALIDIIEKNESIVAKEFGVNEELYQIMKSGNKFDNQHVAELKFIDYINETFIKDVAQSWTNTFGEENEPFVATATHLRSLQKEEERKADKALKIAQTFALLQRAGIQSTDEGLEFLSDLGINLND